MNCDWDWVTLPWWARCLIPPSSSSSCLFSTQPNFSFFYFSLFWPGSWSCRLISQCITPCQFDKPIIILKILYLRLSNSSRPDAFTSYKIFTWILYYCVAIIISRCQLNIVYWLSSYCDRCSAGALKKLVTAYQILLSSLVIVSCSGWIQMSTSCLQLSCYLYAFLSTSTINKYINYPRTSISNNLWKKQCTEPFIKILFTIFC